MANANGWGDGASNNNIGWGKGADNAIGWGAIHADSWAGATDVVGTPAVDPDAQAFITAASITDPTQQSAINTLVVDLKGYNIWTKMKALYPFVGGTAAQHKWNLKDPRDLDAAFRLTFHGGGNWDSNGYTPNGTNAYANTYLAPSAQQSLTSGHFSLYSRTLGASSTVYGGNGVRDQITALGSQLSLRRGIDSLRYAAMWDEGTGGIAGGGAETDARGFYLSSRTANNSLKFYKNNSTIASNTATQTATSLSIYSYFLGAINQSNVALTDSYDNKQLAFASIGDGLTDTDVTNLNTRVTTFQTALNRNV